MTTPEHSSTAPERVLSRRALWRNRVIAITVLVSVWLLLWGVFSWSHLLSGVIVAAVVLRFFPLPPVTFEGRLRPVGLLAFALRFVVDLVTASAQLAWTAFRVGYRPPAAVIGVQLVIKSDLNLTLCAEAVSLVPGSIIIDIDRPRGTLYIHVFNVADRTSIERFRRGVLDLERRVVRAVGSTEEIRLINAVHRASEGGKT